VKEINHNKQYVLKVGKIRVCEVIRAQSMHCHTHTHADIS